MTDKELIESARKIIAAEGKIAVHYLVHAICEDLDCFGEINGSKIDSLQITNDEYPLYSRSKDTFTYVAEAPKIDDIGVI